MKEELEFFATDALPWRHAVQPATEEKVLSRQPDDPAILTRLVRWAPGLDTSAAGVITHDYAEEVYLLDGELVDLTLGQSFRAGYYASRRPGMPHGPYRTPGGCTMLEIRYRVTAR
jgi:ChrR Cupin-like domain